MSGARAIGGEELFLPKTRLGGQYLTFQILGRSYAIAVQCVREIVRMRGVTRVDEMPEYVRGVLDLRGSVVPVLDLGLRLGQVALLGTEQSCILIVQTTNYAGHPILVGMLVDGVEEVAHFADGDIDRIPASQRDAELAYFLGAAKVDGMVKVLLDVDRVIGRAGDHLPVAG